eukprot:9483253-Pyramimonas_sp.AAC.1
MTGPSSRNIARITGMCSGDADWAIRKVGSKEVSSIKSWVYFTTDFLTMWDCPASPGRLLRVMRFNSRCLRSPAKQVRLTPRASNMSTTWYMLWTFGFATFGP